MWAPEWIAPAAAQGVTASSRAGSLFIRPGWGRGNCCPDGRPNEPLEPRPQARHGGGRNGDRHGRKQRTDGMVNCLGGAASRLQSGPVSQRTDLEDRRNPVARGGQPAASQFSGRLAKGAIPVFDKFLDDRLLWLHTNVGRHDNRGNNVVTHRNRLPKSRTRAFFAETLMNIKFSLIKEGLVGLPGL